MWKGWYFLVLLAAVCAVLYECHIGQLGRPAARHQCEQAGNIWGEHGNCIALVRG